MRRSRLDRPAVIVGIAVAAVSMMPVQAWALMRDSAVPTPTVASAPAPRVTTVARAQEPVDHDAQRLQILLEAQQQRKDGEDPARERFEQAYPAHAAARQDVREPATTRWAVLIGINEHLGGVRDNYGSRQDAEELRAHLLAQGWLDDHVLLVTDRAATGETITEALEWLGRKSDENSVAVVHYSGHSKKWYDRDHDGDGEVTDEGLWPTDDAFIADSTFVRLLDAVEGRLWVNIGACNSAGFNDPGLARPGRILTFSSREDQKSYEDPSVDNSVWGHYLFDQGFLQGYADLNADGEITVEEAFAFAAPRAAQRTEGQRYGRQDAVVVDGVDGDFSLRIPPRPAPEPEPDEEQENESRGGVLCSLLCERADGRAPRD